MSAAEFPITCRTCGRKEKYPAEFGQASWIFYCPDCVGDLACSLCGCDGGNGVGGYSNCCGAPLKFLLLPPKEEEPDITRKADALRAEYEKVLAPPGRKPGEGFVVGLTPHECPSGHFVGWTDASAAGLDRWPEVKVTVLCPTCGQRTEFLA